MVNERELEFIDRQLAPLREKQHNCTHPSKKCLVCGLAEDNMYSEKQAEIDVLYAIIVAQDQLLTQHSIPHVTTFSYVISGIIDIWKHDKIRAYNLNKEVKRARQ